MAKAVLRIDCLHVDDEMWKVGAPAARLRKHIHKAVGARDVELDHLERDPLATREYPPEPSRHSGETAIHLRLVQTGSFEEARKLLKRSFYHMVVSDAVKGKPGLERFENYTGYQLLQDVPWRTTQRLLYTQDYYRLHDSEDVDLAAGALGAFITGHPIYKDAKSRFQDRVRRMFEAAVNRPIIGRDRFWVRCVGRGTDDNSEYVAIEILERSDEGEWRTAVESCPLTGFSRYLVDVGPSNALYPTFLWLLGWSRALEVTGKKHPVPEAAPGRGSWVRAITEIYARMQARRDKKRWRSREDFDRYVGGASGFWPGGPQFVKYPGRAAGNRLPPFRLNILDNLEPVPDYWMPVFIRHTGPGGKLVSEKRPVFPPNVLDPVVQFLPRPAGLYSEVFPRTSDDGEEE